MSRFVRMGQRLVSEGLVTLEQLHEAIEVQQQRGERLGSVLIALGHLDADTLARSLGRWYGMPPALVSHFEHCDLALARRLPASLAARHGAIPLGYTEGDGRWVAVAVMDPLPRQVILTLSTALGCKAVLAIAADHLVRRSLRDVYAVAPSGRAAQARMAPPLEHLDEDPVCELELHMAAPSAAQPGLAGPAARAGAPVWGRGAEPGPEPGTEQEPEQEIELDFDSDVADTGAAAGDDSGYDPDGEEITTRRSPYRPAAVPESVPEEDSSRSTNPIAVSTLGRIAIRRMKTMPPPVADEVPFVPVETLEDVLRAIRRATGRDRVAELVVEALRDLFDGVFEVGAVLVVRGLFAVGWKGFIRTGRSESIEALALPLRAESVIASACAHGRPFVGALEDGGTEMDRRMWTILEVAGPQSVAAAPLLMDTPVGCIVYAHSEQPPERVEELYADSFKALAGAAAAALERLHRAEER
ncbi:hypothetical protein [Haliangium sp.]|uniref:GspE/PulE/PilB domain-containing protein n=1 Tax=Haliangium sp. TaxID=2663208 RepID=UPI003D0EE533